MRENEKSPETKLKDMADLDTNDKEFKVVVLEKLREMQDNLERQVSELRNKINKQKEYFIKEIEII